MPGLDLAKASLLQNTSVTRLVDYGFRVHSNRGPSQFSPCVSSILLVASQNTLLSLLFRIYEIRSVKTAIDQDEEITSAYSKLAASLPEDIVCAPRSFIASTGSMCKLPTFSESSCLDIERQDLYHYRQRLQYQPSEIKHSIAISANPVLR